MNREHSCPEFPFIVWWSNELGMPDQENNIENLEISFLATSGSAFASARESILARGLSILQSEQGCIYEVDANGKRILVKTIEPPISVQSGSKITIG